MYEMKMNNLPVNVKILYPCHEETLFEADFQQS